MNIAAIMAVFGVRRRVTETLSGSSWTSPATTATLVSLVGKGQNGTPYVAGTSGYDTFSQQTYYPPNNGTPQAGPYVFLGSNIGGTPPDPYCEVEFNSGGSRTETCYTFPPFDNSQPATNGANTTGFGKMFAGGVGAPANTVTYTNVPIMPNYPYPLSIPTGGSITITYYV